MKIVINKCFGGFSLSPKALKQYMALKGRKCYFFKPNYPEDTNTPLSLEEANKPGLFISAYDIPNPNDLDKENRGKHYIYVSRSDDVRADPDLISVVEKLGEAASGQCAKLKIVEIPDGIEWEIEEYDGLESIHEVHQSWS
jgi:hypothetical protein